MPNLKLGMPIGLVLGVSIGVALDNLGLGIGVGVAFGAALSLNKFNSTDESSEVEKDTDGTKEENN